MISRDFLMRQVHQMTQVLAQVLFKKQAGEYRAALIEIESALTELPEFRDRTLRKIGRDDLLAACRSNGELSTEKAVVMADLLREEAELLLLEERPQEAATAARQALWLYEAAIEHGAALPLDIYQRIERMREVAG